MGGGGHRVLKRDKCGRAAAISSNSHGLFPNATPLGADGRGRGDHADGPSCAVKPAMMDREKRLAEHRKAQARYAKTPAGLATRDRYQRSKARNSCQKRYRQSATGRTTMGKYLSGPAGQATKKRYRSTPEAKIVAHLYNRRDDVMLLKRLDLQRRNRG